MPARAPWAVTASADAATARRTLAARSCPAARLARQHAGERVAGAGRVADGHAVAGDVHRRAEGGIGQQRAVGSEGHRHGAAGMPGQGPGDAGRLWPGDRAGRAASAASSCTFGVAIAPASRSRERGRAGAGLTTRWQPMSAAAPAAARSAAAGTSNDSTTTSAAVRAAARRARRGRARPRGKALAPEATRDLILAVVIDKDERRDRWTPDDARDAGDARRPRSASAATDGCAVGGADRADRDKSARRHGQQRLPGLRPCRRQL